MKFKSKRKPLLVVLVVAIVATLASPAFATTNPTMSVTDSGSTVGPDNATLLDSTIAAPISMVGQTASQVAATWSTDDAVLANTSSIIRPEGWNLEYTTDGTTWSSTPPSPLSLATGIRSAGNVQSQGLDGAGLQVSSRPSSGTILPVSGAIQGGVGGDGYSITFAGTRVLNTWHHQGPTITVDCHIRTTGAQCPRVLISGSYYTSNHAPGGYDDASQKYYTPVVNTATNELGFLCVNYAPATPAPCATPFYAVTDSSTTAAGLDVNALGGAAVEGSNFYLVNSRDNRLLCFNMANAAPCTGFGLTGFATTTHPNTWIGGTAWASDVSAIGGKVYLTIGNTLGCVDPSANPVAWCGGNSPITLLNNASQPIDIFNVPPFPVYDASGTLQMVCEFVARRCITPSGVAASIPSALGTFAATTPIAGNPYLFYSVFEWTVKENKLFWPTELGGVNSGAWSNDAACFDFTTNAPCTGGDIPGVKYDVSMAGASSGLIYAFVADPDPDMSCIWINGDAGVISTFSTSLGSCSGSAVTRFSYNEVVPRMSCNEPGRVREWRNLVITLPNGVNASDLRLTVKDSSQVPQVIAGWNKVPLTSTTVDLSSIAVSTSGTKPTFLITGINKTANDMAGLLADITYVSDPPQLCFELQPVAICALGVPTAGRTAVEPFTVNGVVTAVGASTATTNLDSTVSNASLTTSSCATGGLGGTTTAQGSGAPLGGVVVRLKHPTTGATILQTTSDSQGAYSFPGLAIGTYDVEFGDTNDYTLNTSRTISATVIASTIAQADAVYAAIPVVATPIASDIPADDAVVAATHALPYTGADSLFLIWIAAALVAGGGILVLLRRFAVSRH